MYVAKRKPFEDAQQQLAEVRHELANLKKLLFGYREERFITAPAQAGVAQGRLDLPDEVITKLKITSETVVIRKPAQTEAMTQCKTHSIRDCPAHLRREVVKLEAGKDVTGLRRLGFEVTEVLEYLPRELFVKQYLRSIYIQPTPIAKPVFVIASLLGSITEKWMAGELC